MSNEIILLALMVLSLSYASLASLFGKEAVYICIVSLALTSSVTAGKIIMVFGLPVSVATPIYAGMFLAGDILSEFFGVKDAKKSIYYGFAANVVLISLGLLVTSAVPAPPTGQSDALKQIFSFVPRLVLGGLTAFLVATNVNVALYHMLGEWTKGRHLWLRNNVSTIAAQAIDTTIVYVIAFAGIIPKLHLVILTAWSVKVFVALCDTFFIYGVRKLLVRSGKKPVSFVN